MEYYTGRSVLSVDEGISSILSGERSPIIRQFFECDALPHSFRSDHARSIAFSSDPGMISYRMYDKNVYMKTTPGRVLRKILKDECFSRDGKTRHVVFHLPYRDVLSINDADIEEFSNDVRAESTPAKPIIVIGEAIRWFYYEGSYTQRERSTLHASCMKGSNVLNETRFYAQNPRVCGLLVILDQEEYVKARALLWNTVNGIAMDRCYGSDVSRRAMRNLARERGWLVRATDSAGDTWFVDEHHANKTRSVWVPLQSFNRGEYPYLDSMRALSFFSLYGLTPREQSMSLETTLHRTKGTILHSDERGLMDKDFHEEYAGAVSQEVRNRRIDMATGFHRIPPWPDDLLTRNDDWVVRLPSPESDTKNWERIPEHRESADPLPPRPRMPSYVSSPDWSTTGSTTSTVQFTDNLEALISALNDQAGAAL